MRSSQLQLTSIKPASISQTFSNILPVVFSEFYSLTFVANASIFLAGLEGHRTRWTAWEGERFFPVTRSKRPRFCASSSPFFPARDGSTGGFPYGPGASRTLLFCDEKKFFAYRMNDNWGVPPGAPGWPVCQVTCDRLFDDRKTCALPSGEPGPREWLRRLIADDFEVT